MKWVEMSMPQTTHINSPYFVSVTEMLLFALLFTVDMFYSNAMNIHPFQPLDAASLADLKVALKGFLQKGETIKLETKVLCKSIINIDITIFALVM